MTDLESALDLIERTRLTPTQRLRLSQLVNGLVRAGVVPRDKCGRRSGYLHHRDEGEPVCVLCAAWVRGRAAVEYDRRQRARDQSREQRAQGSAGRRAERKRNRNELAEHWRQVLADEKAGRRHRCDTCP